MSYEKNKFQAGWITDPTGLTNTAVEWTKNLGEFLAVKEGIFIERGDEKRASEKALSTNQLRKFFGKIKRIQAEGYGINTRQELRMLAPQLAYAVGRNKKKNNEGRILDDTKILYFQDEVTKALKAVLVSDEEYSTDADTSIATEKIRFKNFVNLVEAIVAYHKSKGGE